MKYLLLFLTYYYMICSYSQQNLVPNGSFEYVPSCPNYCVAINCAPPWQTPTEFGSPDLFNYCNQNWLQLIIQGQTPHTGNSYAGFYTGEQYTNNPSIFDAMEYIQTELLDTLHAEHYYLVEYYLSLAEWGRYATNNVGVYFSDTAIYRSGIGHQFMLLDYPEQILPFGNPVILDTTDNVWYKVQGIYYATGMEKFITIGNFNSDNETTFLAYNPHDISPIGMGDEAYYYIDDVSVIPLDSMPGGIPAYAGPDQTIYIQDSVFIGQKISNMPANWFKLDGTPVAQNTAGVYVSPLETTTYVVTQTLNGVYSTDTVTVFVIGLGLEEEKMPSLRVYPNPNNGEFEIYFTQKEEQSVNVTIKDISGKEIYVAEGNVIGNVLKINLNATSGLYYIELTIPSSRKTITEKTVIVNK